MHFRPLSSLLLGFAALLLATQTTAAVQEPLDWSRLDSALVRVVDRPDEQHLEVVLGPVELAAGSMHVRLPNQVARLPFDAWLHGFDFALRDAGGAELPGEILHHAQFTDPDARELFAPVALRVLAVSRETGRHQLPRIFGYPVRAGARWLISTVWVPFPERALDEVYLHIWLPYTRRGQRSTAPRALYPFWMDAMGPVGEKEFDVPRGRSARCWEGSPAVDGRMLAVGAHLHDWASGVRFEDRTGGEIIWESGVDRDEQGRVRTMPRIYFLTRGGVQLHAAHTYRVTVMYDNQSAYAARAMGVLAGVIVPDEDTPWPGVDRSDPDYLLDMRNTLRAPHIEHQHTSYSTPSPERHAGEGEPGGAEPAQGAPACRPEVDW